MKLSIFKSEDSEWKKLFESLPADQQDVFYSPAFANVCQQTINREDEVLCAAGLSREGTLLYPFVKRSVSRLTGLKKYTGYYDITGLYGRGGIIGSSEALADSNSFYNAMHDYCRNNAIICGFDRFHPVLANQVYTSPAEKVMEVGDFVVLDVRPSLDDIKKNFKHSVRKSLRKAERNGVTCFAEANADHLDDFINIYTDTMDRNSAGSFYYLDKDYFAAVCREMPGQFHFFYAAVDNEIVACELVLHHGRFCHSFLGGTKRKALKLCANHMLKYEIIKLMKQRGCEYFLLGGGYCPDDGIFNFKKAYAPDSVYSSFIGGMVWDDETMGNIKIDMLANGNELSTGRFQFYDNSNA